MLRRSPALGAIWGLNKLRQPPVHGYELSILPDEGTLPHFLAEHRDCVVHLLVSSGEDCELSKKMTSVLHHTPLGHPRDVKLAMLSAAAAEKLIKDECILALPTTLIYFRGKVIDRVVGTRPRELMVKSRFTLRNNDMSPYSV